MITKIKIFLQIIIMSIIKLCPAMEGIGGLRISSVHINWDGMYEFLWLKLYEGDGNELR